MRTKLKGLNHGWRLFVALALVFSMVPALAVSMAGTAGAVAFPGAVAYGSDFILDEASGAPGTGMARWVWDNIVYGPRGVYPDESPSPIDDFHSSNHSAYLKALGYQDSAMVIVTWGCTIGELTGTELSYWYRTIGEELGPIMGLAIDTNHDGTPNMYAYVSPQPAGSLAWTPWSEDFVGTHWQILAGSLVDWTTLVSTAGPDAKVLAVMVGYDNQRNQQEQYSGEAFVDDITVNDRDWDLEPIDTDCVKSELGAAKSGYPIQIEVDDPAAGTGAGHEGLDQEFLSPTWPKDLTCPSDYNYEVPHQPRLPQTDATARDVYGDDYNVDAWNFIGGKWYAQLDACPRPGLGLMACKTVGSDLDLDTQPPTPMQLTVATCDVATGDIVAPGAGHYTYVHISGTTLGAEGGIPVNDLLYILGTDSSQTTSQSFGTVYTDGINATSSIGSANDGICIDPFNRVWVTYDWHEWDTVTVHAQLPGQPGVDVELIEVNSSTLEPDKDSGYFKGILYPVTTGDVDPDPATPTGLERHDLYADHCDTIQLKYPLDDVADLFAEFGVDNLPPVFSNQSPDPSTNLSQPEISVDISDTKCDVTKGKIHLYVSSVNDNPPFDPGDKVAPADFDFANGTVTYTPPSTLTDGVYYVRVKAADCCWNWAEIDWSFEVESSPPMMIDAVTGWGWNWRFHMPQNRNNRTSIMVVFSERLDPATVEASDFRVNNVAPADVEYHDYNGDWPGGCSDGSHAYGLVFLTLTMPLLTDATPMVKQYGVVEDLAGNPCDKYYEWLCPLDPATLNDLNDPPPQQVLAQDGIAPAITVTASPEEPGYNETVTVTATSSEPLSEAYLFVGRGLPWDYNWDECKPIGWNASGPDMGADIPCEPTGHVPSTAWDGEECRSGEWMLMTEGATPYVWTASFTNEFAEMGQWFVEVAAHDNTQWWVDMDDPEDLGVWYDYECVEHEKRWKHEKWTQESLLFWHVDVLTLELCEGWNLISVPDKLTDPTPLGVFGSRQQGVTKVYHYTGGQYGTWQYAALTPVTGLWYNPYGMTIVPGKAYWVWVSPPWMNLTFFIEPRDALDVPPAIALKKGWNMVGFVDISHCSFGPTQWCWSSARYYFASITTEELQPVMWEYWACQARWLGTALWPPGQSEFWETHDVWVGPGQGYWVSVSEDRTLYPTVGELMEGWEGFGP